MKLLDMPMEFFTQELIEANQAEADRIGQAIKDLDGKIKGVRAKILSVQSRMDNLDGLRREIGLARQERSKALAAGEDHAELSERIASLQAKLQDGLAETEIWEDEKRGLEASLDLLQKERRRLEGGLEESFQDDQLIRYCVMANAYNAQAEILAQTVRALWSLRDGMPAKYKPLLDSELPRPNGVWYNCALWRIPMLRMDWTPPGGLSEVDFFSRAR